MTGLGLAIKEVLAGALETAEAQYLSAAAEALLERASRTAAFAVEPAGAEAAELASEALGTAAWNVRDWAEGTELPACGVVTPAELKLRFDEASRNLDSFAEHLAEADESFAARVERLGVAVQGAREAGSSGALEYLQVRARQGLAGELAERHGTEAFRPYFEQVRTQVCAVLEDGTTRVDFSGEGALRPILYRGHRVPEGGTLRVEFKSGGASYLTAEQAHMQLQAEGHREANAGMTVISKDLAGLPEAREQELRQALREAGSPIYQFLAEKAAYDRAAWRLVEQAAARQAARVARLSVG
jgi:hypothetical protein